MCQQYLLNSHEAAMPARRLIAAATLLLVTLIAGAGTLWLRLRSA